MKIKFIRRIGYDDRPADSVGGLRLGETYYCLGIEVDLLSLEPSRCRFHVLKGMRDGEPQAFYANALCFTVVCARSPESWSVVIHGGAHLVYADPALSAEGILEDFYNDDPIARQRFIKICEEAMI